VARREWPVVTGICLSNRSHLSIYLRVPSQGSKLPVCLSVCLSEIRPATGRFAPSGCMQVLDDDGVAHLLLMVHQNLLKAKCPRHQLIAVAPLRCLLTLLENRVCAAATFRYASHILLQLVGIRWEAQQHCVGRGVWGALFEFAASACIGGSQLGGHFWCACTVPGSVDASVCSWGSHTQAAQRF
jgi:hypothetical protein